MGRCSPDCLLIGDGRLARHLACYFDQLGLRHVRWSRRMQAQGQCDEIPALVHPHSRALIAISDSAIEPFLSSRPELHDVPRVHFSGSLSTPLATGAHPLFSFAGTLYERALYERIPFVIDRGAPALAELIPGLPNPSFTIDVAQRPRDHAMCVLAGNFTTLLWRKLTFELERELGLSREHVWPYLESVALGLKGEAPLSGPLSRKDATSVQRNLEALAGDPFEEVYRAFVSAYVRQGALILSGDPFQRRS